VAGTDEDRNKLSGSVNCDGCLDRLRNCAVSSTGGMRDIFGENSRMRGRCALSRRA
jgi:hypothetical protein